MTDDKKLYHQDENSADIDQAVLEALIHLMANQEFGKISISELCREACISRMTFYRRYASKEDVLRKSLDTMFSSYVQTVLRMPSITRYTLSIAFCKHWKAHQSLLEVLIKQDISYLLIEKFTQYLGVLFGTVLFAKERDGVSSYEVSYHAGGLCSMLIEWVRGGCTESEETMANIIDGIANGYRIAPTKGAVSPSNAYAGANAGDTPVLTTT